MEKQRFCKPYLGRFWLFRKLVGGVWRKYGYSLAGNHLDGWYWTQDDLDFACGGQLTKLKEQNFIMNKVIKKIFQLFERLNSYASRKYAFTVIPTIEIVIEEQENNSYYIDIQISAFLWYCGFLINPKL